MSINKQPLVTVYIPTFNRLELLQRAVESVRNQTYKNLEIVVVDDCSTDGTQKYLEQLAKEDKRVRYFVKEKNSGACVSRNIAIENATGEFITGLDDDDYFLKNRIQDFIDQKDLLNKYEFLYSLYSHKTTEGIKQFKSEYLKPSTVMAKDLLSLNYINNQIFTKIDRLKNVGFDEDMPAWQDLYTWYKLLKISGKKAKLIQKMSYVVDVSHGHERITNKKIEKIKEAFNIFIEKEQLSHIEKKILSCHLINYDENNKNNKNILLSLMNSLSIYGLIVFKSRLLK